jgi:hypothetical protein
VCVRVQVPPCVTPFTLLSRHECALAVPRYGEAPVIPPILINRKTNTPIYSAILTPEERAAIRQTDAFPPANDGSRLDRIERVWGERESNVNYGRRVRAEEKKREREERLKEKMERRARRELELDRRVLQQQVVVDQTQQRVQMGTTRTTGTAGTTDVDMEDVADVKMERVQVKEGRKKVVEEEPEAEPTTIKTTPTTIPNGHLSGSSRDKEKRERDRDKEKPSSSSTQPAVTPQPQATGFGKKKKRVLSSDETDMPEPEPNGSVAVARMKKREDSERPTTSNGPSSKDKDRKVSVKKREEDRPSKPKDEDFLPKKRKLVNGDHERKDRDGLGIGSAPGSGSTRNNRIVSESTLTESDVETRKPVKKGGRIRRNSNASNNTKSERSGERQDTRSVSQTPVPTLGTGIKAIFAGQRNPLQPVERDGMLCWRGHTKRVSFAS